jgi:hypothetical protein
MNPCELLTKAGSPEELPAELQLDPMILATWSKRESRAPILSHFPQGTDVRAMRGWRQDEQAALRVKRQTRVTGGVPRSEAGKLKEQSWRTS